jgi:hypothetical protein
VKGNLNLGILEVFFGVLRGGGRRGGTCCSLSGLRDFKLGLRFCEL